MKRSVDRILTTHGGALRRPDDLVAMISAQAAGETVAPQALAARIGSATQEVVQRQVRAGVDIPNDGEFPKISWMGYFTNRLTGLEHRKLEGADLATLLSGRDSSNFPGWFAVQHRMGGPGYSPMLPLPPPGTPILSSVCSGPVTYVGHDQVATDISNLKAAAQGGEAADLFLSAIGPTMLEWSVPNVHYKTDEEYVFAIAEALREEYKAITQAGIVVQIDEPGLTANWTLHPWDKMTLEEYRRWLAVRIEAMNHALKGVDHDMVRVHCCWGSWHAPHSGDIPLRDIIDLLLKMDAAGLSFEASNPRHEHEWQVWKDVRIPEGKILVPGVIGHFSDYIEHPELVAQRLLQFAGVVGRENVIAGTDCGLGSRVGHPEVCWAKLKAQAEGAALASKQLWSS